MAFVGKPSKEVPLTAAKVGGAAFVVMIGPSPTKERTLERNAWTPDCHAFESGPVYGPVTVTATAATGEFGSAAFSITVTNVPVAIAAIANLAATQVRSGNDTDGTTQVTITYALPPGATAVDVYRVGFGHYPYYDDAGGVAPVAPTTPPSSPWQLTPVTASGQTDEPPVRDYYYYVAFARNACGDLSPASNMTSGVLNYHLGDVSDESTAGQGDNLVSTADISLLGAHYGASGPSYVGVEYLDVGPTTTNFIDGRPLTDDIINFEDLVIFALNYSIAGPPNITQRPKVAAGVEQLQMIVAESGTDAVVAHLQLKGSGALQALSVSLRWDPAVVEPVSCAAGALLAAHNGVALSAARGNVDMAILGVQPEGLVGDGEVATVSFRRVGAGDPKLVFDRVLGRDAANAAVSVVTAMPTGVEPAKLPAVTAFAAPSPNPFRESSQLSFSLAKAGPVTLAIYSVDGRRVRSLVNGVREPGEYHVRWDGRSGDGRPVGAGVYYVRLSTAQGEFRHTVVQLH